MEKRPEGNNADEWHLFLSEYLDNRATFPNGMTFMAVQIAEAIDAAYRLGRAAENKEYDTMLATGIIPASLQHRFHQQKEK